MPAITPGDNPLSVEDFAPGFDGSEESEDDEPVPKAGPEEA